MKKIAKPLAIAFLVSALIIINPHHSVMGKVPSVKTPPASFEVVSLAFTLSGKEIIEVKARVRNSGGLKTYIMLCSWLTVMR